MGLNSSFSLSSRDFPGYKENCIYFTDNRLDIYDEEGIQGGDGFDMGIYNLDDINIETFPVLGYKRGENLFWPPPVWVMQSFPN